MNNLPTSKKLIPILTAVFSVLIGIIYLLLVFILDMRGPMSPPPIEALSVVVAV